MVRLTSSKLFLLTAVGFWLTAALSNTAHALMPDAPTGVTATAGNGSVTVAFAAPANNGGNPITGFTATCGTQSNTGATSPIEVNNLAGGTAVSCTVVAANVDGTSAVSAVSNSVTPILLTAVLSRKVHGSAGTFDLPLDRNQAIGGLVTIEPRVIGAGHTIVFQFNGAITSAGTVTASQGTAVVTFTSNEVLVTLTNIADNQRISLTLNNVNGSVSLPTVATGFLAGDVNNSRTVNASDISAVKARAGASANGTNYLYDVNASGSINSSDISVVKARSGATLTASTAPDPVSITSSAPPPATTEVFYCHPFAASQTIPAGGWTISAGIAPQWVTLNAKRGVICGIPRLTDAGTSTFSVTAANGSSTATQVVTLTVATVFVPPPVITSTPPFSATTNLNYCHSFAVSQTIPSGGWTVSAGSTPEWITLNSKRGVICGIPQTTDKGTYTFTISATNASGTASQAVTLTVSDVALPTPAIISVSPTAGLVGATVTITGTALSSVTSVKIGTANATPYTVNGTGTTITTTVPATATLGLGNVVLGTAASATAATASFVVLAPGSGEFSIDGQPLSAVTKFPQVTPGHGGFNGAGPYVNAYAMEPTRCNTSPPLRRSWQHNIDLADYKQRVASDLFAMQGDEALTYKITIPTSDAGGGFGYQDNVGSGGSLATVFMSVSATPCDFDVSKIPYVASSPTKQCYQTFGAAGGINWSNYPNAGANDYAHCKLTKGQTYYLNIRFVDGINQSATTCPSGLCGGGFTFN